MRVIRTCGSCRFSQSLPLALTVAEPIVTVLSSPLLVDLYSSNALARSCNQSYVVFVDVVFTLITLSSIITAILCLKNMVRLSFLKSDMKANINIAFVLTFALNFILTLIFVSGISRHEPIDEMDDESCWYGFMKKTSWAVGLKSFTPQLLLCAALLVTSTSLCYSKRKSLDEDHTYDNQSLAVGIYLPILSIFFFQLVCFVLRFSFTICTCGWYTLLSRRMGGTLQLCFSKSVVLMALGMLTFFYMRIRGKSRRLLSDSR